MSRHSSDSAAYDGPATAARGALGGLLMGLANLVPGISGGTMLLAVGIYPQVIRSIAEVTTFKFSSRALMLLATVIAGMALAIVAGAGLLKDLVLEHRWIMYSLFIGLTLGGVPILWRMIKPRDATAIIGAAVGMAAMIALVIAQSGEAGHSGPGGDRQYAMLFLAGMVGASAMILPGVSGAYLFLALGQYLIILGAIENVPRAARTLDWNVLIDAMGVIIPVGLGAVVGLVAVSNLIKLLLDRFEEATLGVLLGLLLGAVVGLWPFQRPVVPVGDLVVGAIEAAEFFAPSAAEVAVSLGLIVAGFAASTAVSHLGRNTDAGGR